MPNPDEMTPAMILAELRDLSDQDHAEAAELYTQFKDRDLATWIPQRLAGWRGQYEEYVPSWDIPHNVWIKKFRPGFRPDPELDESRRGPAGIMGVM